MSNFIEKQQQGLVRPQQPRTTKELMAEKARALALRTEAANLCMLLDCSGSMSLSFAETTRYYAMMQALPMLPQGRKVYFNDEVSTNVLPPSGSTNLTTAINHIRFWQEEKVLLISDGEPDSKEAALAAAVATSKRFDVLFIGSDENGKAFMESLAKATGGQVISVNPTAGSSNGTKLLADAANRLLLPPP